MQKTICHHGLLMTTRNSDHVRTNFNRVRGIRNDVKPRQKLKQEVHG